MIGSVLDQVQKLFGKSFLIAAFIPSLILAVLVTIVWQDVSTLQVAVRKWTEQDAKALGLDIVVTLTAVYLIAYVVYGIRSALHQFYQGEWPIPLRLARPLALIKERWAKSRRMSRLLRHESNLNIPGWAIDFNFEPTYTGTRISTEQAESMLRDVRTLHAELSRHLQQNESCEPSSYFSLLRDARILQDNRGHFAEGTRHDIDQLVATIKSDYDQYECFRTAIQRSNEEMHREWVDAYNTLHENFPDDDRWLRPTRLGNIAAVLELYPLRRYGINLSALWPRLSAVIPEDSNKRIEDANTYLDFTIVMSLFSLMATLVSLPAIVLCSSWTLAIRVALTVVFLLSSVLFYRLGIQAMRLFAMRVTSAVDLFRLKLLDALELERPSSPQDERLVWEQLRYFFTQGDVPGLVVRFKDQKTESTSVPPW